MNAFQELQKVDWNNPGSLSTAARAILGVLIFAVVGALGYFIWIKGQLQQKQDLWTTEQTLRQDFEKKQQDAAGLAEKIKQLEQMCQILDNLLKKLPSKTQMPDLLVDISQEALQAGLQSEKFQPQPEILQEFYAEKPIALRMLGTYHEFGNFVSEVAKLPGGVILTMHDVALAPPESNQQRDVRPGRLVLEGRVKTYRYLEPEEGQTDCKAPDQKGAEGAKP